MKGHQFTQLPSYYKRNCFSWDIKWDKVLFLRRSDKHSFKEANFPVSETLFLANWNAGFHGEA